MPLFLFAKGKHYHIHLANNKGKKKHEGLNDMLKATNGATARSPDTLLTGFSIKPVFNSMP